MSPSNNEIEYNMDEVNLKNPVYTVVHFHFYYGYKMNSEKSISCQNPETWNINTPICDPNNVNFLLMDTSLLISS